MRDRLIKKINQIEFDYSEICVECSEDGYRSPPDYAEYFADRLLADGIIVPPVKINQTVYVIDRADVRDPIKEKIVLEIQDGYLGAVFVLQDTPFRLRRAYNFGDVGKTVFLAREEAEKALRKEDEGK